MKANRHSGSKLFLEMWAVWETAMPQSLGRENPGLLLRLLDLGTTSNGIFQVELKSQLGMNQSHLSKLTTKLRNAGWVNVSTPENDRRKSLVKTSKAGKALLASLNKKLGAVGASTPASTGSRKVGKRIRAADDDSKFDFSQSI